MLQSLLQQDARSGKRVSSVRLSVTLMCRLDYWRSNYNGRYSLIGATNLPT